MTRAYAIAYLEFEREEDAAKAVTEMHGQSIQDHIIQVEFYDKSQQDHITINPSDLVDNSYLKALFIRGINKSVSSRSVLFRKVSIEVSYLLGPN